MIEQHTRILKISCIIHTPLYRYVVIVYCISNSARGHSTKIFCTHEMMRVAGDILLSANMYIYIYNTTYIEFA